jgi:hypothetical protein
MKRICALAFVIPAFAAAAQAATAAGNVVSVMGQVSIQRSGQKELAAKVGNPLLAGDTVLTGPDSAAKLMMIDQSILDLGPSTAFRIDQFEGQGEDRQAESEVDFGRVRASVNRKLGKKGKFLMRTKSSLMAVRGTEFVVASDATAAQSKTGEIGTQFRLAVAVLDGLVEVTVPELPSVSPVLVSAGQQMKNVADLFGKQMVMRTAAGVAGETQSLTPAQMQGMAKQVRMEDQTFRQAVVVSADAGASYGRHTLSYIANRLTLPPGKPPKPQEILTPGTFSSLEAFNPNQSYPAATPINIKIVISP